MKSKRGEDPMYYYADEFEGLLKENPDYFFENPDILLEN